MFIVVERDIYSQNFRKENKPKKKGSMRILIERRENRFVLKCERSNF